MRDGQNKKTDGAPGAAKRDEKKMRLPPSELKRLAEHLNAPNEQRKDLRAEMRESERRRRVEEYLDEDEDDDTSTPQGTAYSAIEVLRKKDFESFTWDEVQEAKKLMAEMRWRLGQRQTRRKRPARRGSYPDMRRIVRRNLKYGAELIELTWRGRKLKTRPPVCILVIKGLVGRLCRVFAPFFV